MSAVESHSTAVRSYSEPIASNDGVDNKRLEEEIEKVARCVVQEVIDHSIVEQHQNDFAKIGIMSRLKNWLEIGISPNVPNESGSDGRQPLPDNRIEKLDNWIYLE